MTAFLEMPFDWLRRAAPYRLFWLGGPLLLYSWTIFGPFVSDDMHLLLKSESYLRGETEEARLYRFASNDDQWRAIRDRGTCPWWLPQNGRQDFFRPLSQGSFLLDVSLFGRNPLGYRLMSLAIFLIALKCTHWMYVQSGGDRVLAGSAAFFLGISQALMGPVAWISNRQDLFVLIGVTLSTGAYWAALRAPRWRLVLPAVGGFAVALLAKELAVSLFLVIGLHELIRRFRPSISHVRPNRVSGFMALALTVVGVGYLTYYCYSRPWAMNLGSGAGLPSQLDAWLPLVLLGYAAVWTIGFPIDALLLADPLWLRLLVALSACVLLIPVYRSLKRIAEEDGTILFFALWAILFIAPALRAIAPSARYLSVATAGWAYLLAAMLAQPRGSRLAPSLLQRQWFYAANGIVSVGCVVAMVLYLNKSEMEAQQRVRSVLSSLSSPLRDGDAVFLANALSETELLCTGARIEYQSGTRDVSAYLLVAPGIAATFSHVDSHTLMVRSRGGSLFGTPLHRLAFGRDWEWSEGTTFHLREFAAEISDVGDDGSVRAMTLRFNEPLGSRRYHFIPPQLSRGELQESPTKSVLTSRTTDSLDS